jgi:hypothetical protein
MVTFDSRRDDLAALQHDAGLDAVVEVVVASCLTVGGDHLHAGRSHRGARLPAHDFFTIRQLIHHKTGAKLLIVMLKSSLVLGLAVVLVAAAAACTHRGEVSSTSTTDEPEPAPTVEQQAGKTVDHVLEVGGRSPNYHVHYPVTVPDGPRRS